MVDFVRFHLGTKLFFGCGSEDVHDLPLSLLSWFYVSIAFFCVTLCFVVCLLLRASALYWLMHVMRWNAKSPRYAFDFFRSFCHKVSENLVNFLFV